MIKQLKFISYLFLFVFGLSMVTFGQETVGDIEGTIKDPSDAVIANATVQVTGVNLGFNRTVTTDSNGNFRVLQVPPGNYRVVVNATGFAASTTDIIVNLGQTSIVRPVLTIGAVGATVNVTGDDFVPIDTTSNTINTSITERKAELTPKTSPNFAALLRISPAVREEPLGAGFQIDGSSGAENTFIVDGLEVTNFRTGQLRNVQNIPNSFVREVQVKTSGFNAEYGGATGGVINVVTRGGDNKFRGELGTQFEISQLNATTRPNAITSPFLSANSGAVEFIRPGTGGSLLNPPKDEFTNFYPVGRFSGPVIKDRLWFFASAAPQYFTTTRNSVFGNGTSRPETVQQRNDYYLGRLDAQVFSRLRLTGTFTYNPQTVRGRLVPFNTSTDPGDFSQRGGRVNSNNTTFQGFYTPTSNLIFSVRAGRAYLNEKDGAYGIPNATRFRCLGNATVLRTNFSNFGCGFGDDTGDNFLTNKDISIRNTLDTDVSVIAPNLLGRHIFKFGYQRNAIKNDVDQGFFNTGRIDFRFGQSAFGQGSASTGNVQLTRFGTVGLASSTNTAIFAQDNWQIARRLTLNVGLRAERENVPTFSATGVPIKFGFGDKLAPRFGFAYDVFGNGKTKIFGSFGYFYDRFKYELPRGSFGGDRFLRTFLAIPAGANISQFTVQSILANPAGVTIDFRVPSNDPSDNRIDPDLKAQRQTEFTVGVERELYKDLVLRSRYTRKKLNTAIEDVGFIDNDQNENFFIANPGRGIVSQSFATGLPATPKAERQYDAFEVNVEKRFAQNYFVDATYTYSRLFGNFSGLASSDERGRSSPNVNRFFDLPFLGFNTNGVPDNARLATDRPHAVKVFGGYTLDYKGRFLHGNSTDFTAAFIGQSGTPLSTQISIFNANTFLFGRGDLGRTERFTQTDLAVTHRYRFGRDNRFGMEFMVNATNVFNQNHVVDVFTSITANDVSGQQTSIFTRENGTPLIVGRTATGTPIFASGPIDQFTNCQGGVCSELNVFRAIFAGGLQTQLVNLVNNNVVLNSTRTFTDENGNRVVGRATATDNLTRDARYLQPQTFQDGRRIRFGFAFNF